MPDRTVTVVPEDGLHARPGATFVETAANSDVDVRVGHTGGDLVNAASMLAVTGLGVECGDEVRVVADGADGADAEATLDELERVLTTPEDEL
jgi:phosphocarrier protein HPr